MRKFIQPYLLALMIAPLSCIAAEPWDFLEIDLAISRAIGVKGITRSEDIVVFNVLDGYMPYTADLGYGRAVGGRIRFVIHRCGSPTVEIAHLWVRDATSALFIDEENKPPKSMPLQSDDAVRKAALYACGDKSQKVEKIAHPVPKDAVVLVCRNDRDGKEQTYIVSESAQTVDGRKAIFSPSTIYFLVVSNDKDSYKLEINRYSGSYRVMQGNFEILSGKCVKQDKKQF